MEDIHRSLGDINKTVHELAETKQDKIKLVVVIPIVIYLLTQLGLGIWWASETSHDLEAVLIRQETILASGFNMKDAEVLEQKVDLKIENLGLKIREEFSRDKEK